MTVTSLVQGSIFAGRYRVVRCIAHGGMGAVYEVVHIETERRRALKVMLPSMVQSQDMQSRFRLEARVTANVESEFIVDVADAGVDAETQMPFLVMEYLRGEELSKRLKRVGRFEPHEVVTYLHQTAMALDKTHQASIVHRDLKPGNLFLTERDDGSPRIKVLDFGIAKLVAENTTQGGMTQSLGTPLYMAPEQFKSGHRVSPASDIYSLAMVAYHLLVGKAYWAQDASDNVYMLIASAVQGPQESARARAHRLGVLLPPAFDSWFFKAAAVKPSDRYPTAGEAVFALAEALGVEPPNRRRTVYPDQQRSQHYSLSEIAPSSYAAPSVASLPPPVAPMTPPGMPITPPGMPMTAPGMTPPSAPQQTFAAARPSDPRLQAPPLTSAGPYPSATPMPPPSERMSPRPAPSHPQGAMPPPSSPITPATGAGFSHTSAGYGFPERRKNPKLPIILAAGISFAAVAITMIALLVGGGSSSDSDARGSAVGSEQPAAAPTSTATAAAPTVSPAPPPGAAPPVKTAEPEPPTAASTAAAATTSKPKTPSSGGKTTRPTSKPKLPGIYTPE